MKRIIIAACLAIVAVAVVPVASASAATGTCHLEGTATFNPALEFKPKAKVKYSFKAEGSANTCVGTGGSQAVVEASVEGEGNLGCQEGTRETGTGKLKLSGEATAKEFSFFFTANGPIVNFSTTGAVTAEGTASFASDPEGLKRCGQMLPVEALKFQAQAAGSF